MLSQRKRYGYVPNPSSGGGVPAGSPMTVGAWAQAWASGNTVISNPTLNRLFLIPRLIGRACTLGKVALQFTVASVDAGSIARLGAYTDANGVPAALISEFGTVPTDAIGDPQLTVSVPLPVAWIWDAIVFQNNPTTRPTVAGLVTPTGFPNRVPSSAATTYQNLIYVLDGVTGALPASLSGLTPSTSTLNSPLMMMQASA